MITTLLMDTTSPNTKSVPIDYNLFGSTGRICWDVMDVGTSGDARIRVYGRIPNEPNIVNPNNSTDAGAAAASAPAWSRKG